MSQRFVVPFVVMMSIIVLLEVLAYPFALLAHPQLGYDKLLHFLGGGAWGIFGIGVLASGFLYDVFGVCDPLCTKKTHNRRVLWFAIVSSLFFGVLWEVAQVHFHWLRDASDYDWWDTRGDIIFDALGGFAISWRYQLREH